MIIQQSIITKLLISNVPNLDPVTVYAEDIGPRQGKIVIECAGKSWAARWGSMGSLTISEFFRSCDEHYLAKNLSNIPGNIFAPEKVVPEGVEKLTGEMKEVIRQRKNWLLYKSKARDEYDTLAQKLKLVKTAIISDDPGTNSDVLRTIYGEEWWHFVPTKPNPAYDYLCRVIHAVQDALQTLAPADNSDEEESSPPAPAP